MGQINQYSGNKMGGVKTINMRAHGTQKTKTKAMCSHKTKGAFDFKQCCAEWSVYDIKVPRER